MLPTSADNGSDRFFSAGWWLAARLSRLVGGVPRALGFSFLNAGTRRSDQPGASTRSCCMAAVI